MSSLWISSKGKGWEYNSLLCKFIRIFNFCGSGIIQDFYNKVFSMSNFCASGITIS